MNLTRKIAFSRILFVLLLTLTAYACAPIHVYTVVPDIGTLDGGIEITIYGDGFKKKGVSVWFGDQQAQSFEIVADDIITAVVPGALREGAVEVRIETQEGAMGILPSGFTYYEPGQSLTYTLPGYHLPANNGAGCGGDAVDVDDDGDIDVLVANGPVTDRLYENLLAETGELNFASHDLPGVIRDSMDVQFIDGFAFVVKNRIVMDSYGKNCLFKVDRDDRDGSFIFEDYSAGNLPDEFDFGMKAAVGDIDNDGDKDIFVANGYVWRTHPSSPNKPKINDLNRIYLNQGDTDGDGAPNFEFTTAASFPEIAEISIDVALGDLDNDGALDVVVGNFNDNPGDACPECRNRVYRNTTTREGDGTPAFDDVTDIWFSEMPEIVRTTNVELGDVDEDGDLDLLVVTTGEVNLLFINEIDRIGRFVLTDGVLPTDPQIDTHLYQSNYDAKFADFNGDGHLDILIGGEILRVFLGNGDPEDPRFTEISSDVVPFLIFSTLTVRVADFDEDGGPDFVCLDSNEQDRLFLNDLNLDGSGSFVDYTSDNLPPDGEHAYDAEFGDFDGDDDLDIVVANSYWTNRLFLNRSAEGGEGFADASNLLPEVYETHMAVSRDVEIFDANGDGHLDLLFTNSVPMENRLYINNGQADFTDETDARFPTGTSGGYGTDTGDIDGDGDLDIVTAIMGQSRVYLNDGDGFFADVTETHIPQTPSPNGLITHGIQLADLDGDGDLDAVLANYASRNRFYLNDGTGRFNEDTEGRFPEEEMLLSKAIAIGDVDNDGDPDIFFANGGEYYYKQNWLYLNDGNGFFTNMHCNLPLLQDGSMDAKLEDVNRDGLLDILVVNFETSNRFLFNDPASPGTFYEMTRIAIEATVAGVEDLGYDAAFGDTDGDGTPELLTANDGQNRLFFLDAFAP